MRRVVGYDKEGHKIWSENVPAETALHLSGAVGGSLDYGVSSSGKPYEASLPHSLKKDTGIQRVGCHLDGRCLHKACIQKRRAAAVQMRETGLSLPQIGLRLGRDYRTVSDLIRGKYGQGIERCGGGCARPLGHEGSCRASWQSRPTCGVWMPQAKETCARREGHNNDHRTRFTMSNAVARVARRRAA